MNAPVYIGDEVTAAGFRLAGVRVIVPPRGEEANALAQARRETPVVFLGAAVAARIAAAVLDAALRAEAPIVAVVPDHAGEAPHFDIASRLSAELGLNA